MMENSRSDREVEAGFRELMKTVTKSLCIVGDIDPLLSMIVDYRYDLQKKYVKVALSRLLSDNCTMSQDAERLAAALTVLSKYAMNLMKPPQLRPNGWMTVSFQNQIFRDKVNSIQGTHKILFDLGYTQEGYDYLQFPQSTQSDTSTVSEITVELLACKAELEAYYHGKHPHPDCVKKYISSSVMTKSRIGNIPVTVPKQMDEESYTTLKKPIMMNDSIPENGSYVTTMPKSISLPTESETFKLLKTDPLAKLTQQSETLSKLAKQSNSESALPRPQNSESALPGPQNSKSALPKPQNSEYTLPRLQNSESAVPRPIYAEAKSALSKYVVSQPPGIRSGTPRLPIPQNLAFMPSQIGQPVLSKPSIQESTVPPAPASHLYPGNIPLSVLDETLSLSVASQDEEIDKCDICASEPVEWLCHECDNKILCTTCDGTWHQHPKRRGHRRSMYHRKPDWANVSGEPVAAESKISVENKMIPSTVYSYTLSSSGSRATSGFSVGSERKPSSTLEKISDWRSPNSPTDLESMVLMAKHPPSVYIPPAINDKNIWGNPREVGAAIGNEFQSVEWKTREESFDSSSSSIKDFELRSGGKREKKLFGGGGLDLSGNPFDMITWQWSCEHCTYINICPNPLNIGARICEMCAQSTRDPIFNKTVVKGASPPSSHAGKLSQVPSGSSLRSSGGSFGSTAGSGYSASGEPEYRSRFIEMQDEVYRKKKKVPTATLR